MNDAMTDDVITIDNYMEQPVVLDVSHVDKWFKLPTEQASGLKQAFINWTKGIKGYKEQHVLRDVSFQVHQGEFFGIVGRNGGGKSTLLKIISQIYYPNRGSVDVRGKLVPFIELGVGFNPELTGRENVYLNGALLGFSHDEVDEMYDDIVEFAELEEFMDQKLKNYSSGMQVRLAFSVAIKAQGDILVLDEVLAVGDEAFQRKCDDYFSSVRQDPTKTVILVTHDMGAIKRYCTRAMFIQDGEVAAIGDKETVAESYTLANLEAMRQEERQKAERADQAEQEGHEVYPNGLNARCPLLRTYAISPLVLTSDQMFRFAVEYEFNETDDFYLAIALHDIRRGGITFDTGAHNPKLHMTKKGRHTVYFEMPLDLFNNGEFRLFTSLRTPIPGNTETTDMVAVALDDNACTFAVRDPRNMDYALINTRAMQIEPISKEQAEQSAAGQYDGRISEESE